MSDIQDDAVERKENIEHSVIHLMMKETIERLKDVYQSKESNLEEEIALLFKIEYLNNLLINKNKKIISLIL